MSIENALDRLNRCSNQQEQKQFTLDEQMESSVSTDEYLDGMSTNAKAQFDSIIQEVTIDEPEAMDEPEIIEDTKKVDEPNNKQSYIENSINDETDSSISKNDDSLFNNNNENKPKRKYTKRNKTATAETKPAETKVNDSVKESYNSSPILDQLCKDLIDDLRNNKYKINRFDDRSMKLIFEYLYNKI